MGLFFKNKKQNKFVYAFKEGNKDMRDLLGGKGANLAEMTCIGLPVPQGFIVTTEACNKYYEDNLQIDEMIKIQIIDAIINLEQTTGKKFGDLERSEERRVGKEC